MYLLRKRMLPSLISATLATGAGVCVAADTDTQANAGDTLNGSLVELTQIENPAVVGASKLATASVAVVSAHETRGWLSGRLFPRKAQPLCARRVA